MKVILRSDVDNVGKKGDTLDVASGFARNFLLPRGLAFVATPGSLAQASAMRRARDIKDANERSGAQEIARRLVAAVVTIRARAGTEGRLFGSVTSADVVAAVSEQTGVELDRRKVMLREPIKSLGSHGVPVKLHADVEFTVNVEVVAG